MCRYNYTHACYKKKYSLHAHSHTHTHTNRTQLVSLINPNEVGLYYQKWEEQQVLLRAWHITARTPEQKQFKTDPDSVNEQTRDQRVTAHTLHLIRNPPNPQDRAIQKKTEEREEETEAPDLNFSRCLDVYLWLQLLAVSVMIRRSVLCFRSLLIPLFNQEMKCYTSLN